MKYVKYIGQYSGAEVRDLSFEKGVLLPVKDELADRLLSAPDFAEGSEADFTAQTQVPVREAPAKPAQPAPAPTPVKETK